MRQLELTSTKSVRRRRTQPETSPAALALKDEEVRELLKLMAQALIAVARSGKEDSDER
jgi:hypothetical protein